MITLLLSGCAGGGSREHRAILDVRAHYLALESVDLTADVTADYGGRVYDYQLCYVGGGKSGELTVLKPENIAGMGVSIDKSVYGGAVKLRYEGAELDTGAVAGADISPVGAFPLMITSWRDGYILASWREEHGGVDCIAAEIRLSEAGLSERVWFDAATFAPVQADLYSDGFRVITAVFVTAGGEV
jgi:hypothetical protein